MRKIMQVSSWAMMAVILGVLVSCISGAGQAEEDAGRVIIGAERLTTPEYFSLIRNKRVALVTNHTGLLPDGRHIVDVLHDHPEVELTVLFGPEHGIRGDADTHVADGVDQRTGLPVKSLYGKVRKPTSEMLENVDVLIFDIQDIGARFYTYIATMNHVLEAAAENGIPYIVLDRPNAIGGEYVDGPVGKPAPVTGVGGLPVTHGMTVGELAMMFNGERKEKGLQQAELTVIPMLNWRREAWYDETGLPWVKPSPNMLTLTTATVYPTTCLLEGTNVSEARGTLHPFEHIGAPWIDGKVLADTLNAFQLDGVRFEPDTYVPDSVVDGIRIYPPKFVTQECQSARITVTDRQAFRSAEAAVYMLYALNKLYPQQFQWRDSRMDRLWGTSAVREQLVAGAHPKAITESWRDDLEQFMKVRERYLLYQ